MAERRLAESLLPAEPAVAARWSVAVMELGALVCTAASPRCAACPVARDCAWLAAGRPPIPGSGAGPSGTTARTGSAAGACSPCCASQAPPRTAADFDAVWADQAQLDRALDGLVADGLVDPLPDGRYALPGARARGWDAVGLQAAVKTQAVSAR